VAALREGRRTELPLLVGGRYGLSSKEVTPAMLAGVLDALAAPTPPHGFTVGIHDDVTRLSLPWDDTAFAPDLASVARTRTAVFYGLGSDGTVSATKAAAKIIGEHTDSFVQGYFVYDSKKSGSITVSHLKVADEPVRGSYLVREADVVAVHQFGLLERLDVLGIAAPGATVLLNSPYPAADVWDHLPGDVQGSSRRASTHGSTVAISRGGAAQRINSGHAPGVLRALGRAPQGASSRYAGSSGRRTPPAAHRGRGQPRDHRPGGRRRARVRCPAR
jgi:Pyruvate/2-oxoacid:ferredoxin oxidoreductase gamma subunit